MVNLPAFPAPQEHSGLRQDTGMGAKSQGRKEDQPESQWQPDSLPSLTLLGTGDKVCFDFGVPGAPAPKWHWEMLTE